MTDFKFPTNPATWSAIVLGVFAGLGQLGFSLPNRMNSQEAEAATRQAEINVEQSWSIKDHLEECKVAREYWKDKYLAIVEND